MTAIDHECTGPDCSCTVATRTIGPRHLRAVPLNPDDTPDHDHWIGASAPDPHPDLDIHDDYDIARHPDDLYGPAGVLGGKGIHRAAINAIAYVLAPAIGLIVLAITVPIVLTLGRLFITLLWKALF